MHRAARAVSATMLAATAAICSPAHSAPVLTVDATFASTVVNSSCTTAACTFTSTSATCVAGGVNGATGAPYTGGCTATISLTIDRAVIHPHLPPEVRTFCMAGRGSLTFRNDYGTVITLPITSALTLGNVTSWWATGLTGPGGPVTVIGAQGQLGGVCVPGETPRQLFTGTLRYLGV